MGYFPNSTAWEFWAVDNCYKCAHWPKDDDAPGCPVELAHERFSYELCNAKDDPGKIILDLLIPSTKDDLGCGPCAMFKNRHGVTERHLKDWAKYQAIMAEATGEAA